MRSRRLVHCKRGRLARMDNRGPAAHCGRMTVQLSAEGGQHARACRSTSQKNWLDCKDDGVTCSPGVVLCMFAVIAAKAIHGGEPPRRQARKASFVHARHAPWESLKNPCRDSGIHGHSLISRSPNASNRARWDFSDLPLVHRDLTHQESMGDRKFHTNGNPEATDNVFVMLHRIATDRIRINLEAPCGPRRPPSRGPDMPRSPRDPS